ncbi:MAG: GTP 3',8-cyclase MoaA [Cyanobacteria bacterium J06632_3]
MVAIREASSTPNRIDYLRISLIDRCNFQCVYCMPEGADLQYALKEHWLTHDEILRLLKEVFIPVGFTRFRLTGGEPLLRPGIVELVDAIAHLPQTQDLALTTNGFRLKDLAQPLYDAGLKRINISLDSLNADTFENIIGGKGQKTNQSRWQDVWEGIQTAYTVGFSPLKLNVVVIPGVNDHEVLDLAALSIDKAWHVRFIEFMPIGNDTLFEQKGWVDSETIRNQIANRWGIETSTVTGNGPADIFKIPGAKGTLGFISQMSECFCDRCNRMRLSADGMLRPCLLNESGQIDLRTNLRSGTNIQTIRQQVATLVGQKPEINFKMRESGVTGAYSRTMSQIGG